MVLRPFWMVYWAQLKALYKLNILVCVWGGGAGGVVGGWSRRGGAGLRGEGGEGCSAPQAPPTPSWQPHPAPAGPGGLLSLRLTASGQGLFRELEGAGRRDWLACEAQHLPEQQPPRPAPPARPRLPCARPRPLLSGPLALGDCHLLGLVLGK